MTYNIPETIYLNKNERVAFSGNNDAFNTFYDFYHFEMSGAINSYGNVQSLLNFSNTTQDFCYKNLFEGCSSLLTAPHLPATVVKYSCYYGMFEGCTSLKTPPSLPATTLANNCYEEMFANCSSLTAAPQLPATELKYRSYHDMFYNCSSLITAPQLPASTLTQYCYESMFTKCAALTSIEVNFTDWNGGVNTSYWVKEVAPTGIFTKPYALNAIYSYSHIPEGWTVINK